VGYNLKEMFFKMFIGGGEEVWEKDINKESLVEVKEGWGSFLISRTD